MKTSSAFDGIDSSGNRGICREISDKTSCKTRLYMRKDRLYVSARRSIPYRSGVIEASRPMTCQSLAWLAPRHNLRDRIPQKGRATRIKSGLPRISS
jgi:hypothetical protein